MPLHCISQSTVADHPFRMTQVHAFTDEQQLSEKNQLCSPIDPVVCNEQQMWLQEATNNDPILSQSFADCKLLSCVMTSTLFLVLTISSLKESILVIFPWWMTICSLLLVAKTLAPCTCDCSAK